MQDEVFDKAARAYVERHFWTPEILADAVGAPWGRVEAWIAAGVSPGAVYARDPERGWWSALGGWVDEGPGEPPAGSAEIWLSPWTAWALRRASLVAAQGGDADSAGLEFDRFHREFSDAVLRIPAARVAFADCFGSDGALDASATFRRAGEEWAAWIEGGYAVCLRAFTGATCVEKESLGALLRRHNADPALHPLSAADCLDACATLSGLMLPFAPWERARATPGVTIDVILERLELGSERPYG